MRTTRLESKAIVERWPITAADRRAVIRRLANIMRNKRASRREVTAAARALIAADRINVADEKLNDGFTQDELARMWTEAVQAAVEAELARRQIRAIESQGIGGHANDGETGILPSQAMAETTDVSESGGD